MVSRPSIKPPVSQKLSGVVHRGACSVASNTALPTGRTRVIVSSAVRVIPFRLAEIVAEVLTEVVVVVTVKVPVWAPPGMARVVGTVAMALLLVKLTTEPPAGAACDRVTVPVDGCPLTTVVGLSVSEAAVGDASTVSVAVCVTDAGKVPEIVTAVCVVVAWVVIVKVALNAPAGTVTVAGTCAMVGALLDSDTTAPPTGAGSLSVAVPVAVPPPSSDVGLTVSETTVVARVTARTALAVVLWNAAEIVALVFELWTSVVTVNVAVDIPPATTTVAGTVATAVLPLASATVAPPAGAGPVSATVPVAEVPPTTVVGDSASEATVGDASTVMARVAVVESGKVAVTVTAVSVEVAIDVTVNVAL